MKAAHIISYFFVVHTLLPFPSTTTFGVSSVSAMSTSTIQKKFRVVSYNLLSSKLARPSHFTHSEPEHLEFEYRLPRILSKLDDAMKCQFGGQINNESDNTSQQQTSTDGTPTIFALQEVCYPFASSLHTFFAQRGYHFVTGLYGRPFNGYMGVAIAYPLEDFDTINVDICRLSDERPSGWPREKEEDDTTKGIGLIQRINKTYRMYIGQTIQSINSRVMKRLGYSGEKPPVDHWKMSENRFNVLLTVTLKHHGADDRSAFSVSNYHMPCAFYAPPVMNIHADMVSKRVQDLAAASWKSIHNVEADETKEDDDETAADTTTKKILHILAGDFNILPDSSHYKLLTTGKLDRSDPTYPSPGLDGVEWKVESNPMDSAYTMMTKDGTTASEPEFTNYAHIKEDPKPFIGTLDYIFLSKKECTSSHDEVGKSWKVHSVEKLPSIEESGGPFPNKDEPSDHILIASDLEII